MSHHQQKTNLSCQNSLVKCHQLVGSISIRHGAYACSLTAMAIALYQAGKLGGQPVKRYQVPTEALQDARPQDPPRVMAASYSHMLYWLGSAAGRPLPWPRNI